MKRAARQQTINTIFSEVRYGTVLQITARDIEITDAIRADITEKAEKLDKFYDRIMRCGLCLKLPNGISTREALQRILISQSRRRTCGQKRYE
jgi:hypothetical protein